jgi:TetR/AcrR family transcriptional regulator
VAPRTGERKLQILQTLASMLEHPRGERVTTAALAARLSVSEAELYRHFASKAQMFEGLIEFIESSLFSLINRISAEEPDGQRQAQAIVRMLLSFAEKNPGMVRVLIGDALLNEDDRLQVRINQLLDRIESTLRQSLRLAALPGEEPASAADERPTTDGEAVAARANLLLCHVIGRWVQYARSGFKRLPTAQFSQQWALLA